MTYKINECQYVKNPEAKAVSSQAKEEDDDDDFEEDEDEEEKPKADLKGSKVNVSPLSKLVCSLKDFGNKKLEEKHDFLFEETYERFGDRIFTLAAKNVWYTQVEFGYSLPLMCSGVELITP